MRTAIYVRQPSVVTIRATDPRDADVELSRYNQPPGVPAIGKHALEPGIYLVISTAALLVDGLHGGIEIQRHDKDEWPDPKPNVIELEPNATADSLRSFFTIAKDISF